MITCNIHVPNLPSISLPLFLYLSLSISCALPVSMLVRPVVKEMTDCPLLRGAGQGNQDIQVRRY